MMPRIGCMVCRDRAVRYKDREPYAEDVVLLIKVADTSLRDDRWTKT